MSKRLKRGEITKRILLGVVSTTVVVGVAAVLVAMPGLGLVLKDFADWHKKQNSNRQHLVRRSFEKLRRERLIKIKEIKNGTLIVLTENGKKKVLQFNLENLKVLPQEKWDGKWRMIIFDIPENLKRARYSLRNKFKEWDFYPLQKSVWVWPYECRSEIDFLIEFWHIGSYVRIVEANKFDGEEFVRKHFGLSEV